MYEIHTAFILAWFTVLSPLLLEVVKEVEGTVAVCCEELCEIDGADEVVTVEELAFLEELDFSEELDLLDELGFFDDED